MNSLNIVSLAFESQSYSSALKVGNDVSTILLRAQACECHGVSGGELRRSSQPLVEVTVCPFKGGFTLKCVGIGESFSSSDVGSWKSSEGWSN